mgnify:CR=1 FL=1
MSDKDKASIPIIAMTANAFEEDKRDAIAAGMNGHIAKPIQVDKLLSILSEVIRKQSLYRLKNGTMGKTDDVLPIMDILVSRLVCFEFGLWFVMEDCR